MPCVAIAYYISVKMQDFYFILHIIAILTPHSP